jgi:tRNA pseudouridine55 synthase
VIDREVEGLLNLNKPSGVTSRDVVDRVAQLLPRVKVGHAGTLDPLASGVLVVCIGSTTRLIESLQRMAKSYRAVVRLGAQSNTLDADGQVIETDHPDVPSEDTVRQAMTAQVGEISQIPPQFSALKSSGKRAYELARAGQTAHLGPRLVRIDRVDLVTYKWPFLELEITCGGGTYIRSIARDLGNALGCGGLVKSLVRTRIGPFDLEGALDPDSLSQASLRSQLRSPLEAVPDLPRVVLTGGQVAAVRQGRPIDATGVSLALKPRAEAALLDHDGRLIAIAVTDTQIRTLQPRKVLG